MINPKLKTTLYLWLSKFWVQILLLFISGLFVYATSFSNEFLLDDEEQVVANPTTMSVDNIPKIFFYGALDGQEGPDKGLYYRPMMITCFTLLRAVFGLDSTAFHAFQFIVHFATSLLFFLMMKRFVTAPLAFIAALLFLVHPMNTEAVVYSSSLQDPLFALFGVMGLLAVMVIGERIGFLHAIPLAVIFLLSLFSKETATLLIFMTFLYAISFAWRATLPVVVASCTASAIYLMVRVGAAGMTEVMHSSTQLARATFPIRALNLPLVLTSYFHHFLWPSDLAVTQDWIIKEASLARFWLPLAFVVSLFSVALTWVIRKRDKEIAYFLVWITSGLALHSHMIAPLDGTVAERWFYFTCMGVIAVLFIILNRLLIKFTSGAEPTKRIRTISVLTYAFLISVTIAYGIRAHFRSLDWRDGYTLYSTDIERHPDSAHLQNNLGVELVRRGRINEAHTHFEKSIGLNPYWNISWSNYGVTWERLGNFKKAEESYLKSMELGPYLRAYYNYAAILLTQNRFKEAKEFIKNKALKLYPSEMELKKVLAELEKVR